jgi:hypothetical protein
VSTESATAEPEGAVRLGAVKLQLVCPRQTFASDCGGCSLVCIQTELYCKNSRYAAERIDRSRRLPIMNVAEKAVMKCLSLATIATLKNRYTCSL